MASSIEAIQKILQETIAPSVSRIEIELAGVKANIKSLQSEIKRLDERIDHLDDKLTTALEIREPLAALEARVAAH